MNRRKKASIVIVLALCCLWVFGGHAGLAEDATKASPGTVIPAEGGGADRESSHGGS